MPICFGKNKEWSFGRFFVRFHTSSLENNNFIQSIFFRDVFMKQGAMLELEAPVKICGDVHGQYSDVLRLFDRGGFPPLVNYLFLGDYVDRGQQSLEVACLFLAYKVKFPGNFFMLRGNHECGSINRVYGFLDEVQRKYGAKGGTTMWNCFQVSVLIFKIKFKMFVPDLFCVYAVHCSGLRKNSLYARWNQ